MKALLLLLLLPLSFTAIAESRQVKICDKSYNCKIVTIRDYGTQTSNDALLRAIAESGSKNFDRINRGWNPQQYPQYPQH